MTNNAPQSIPAKTGGILQKIGLYFSLVKISHTVFALPFACIGFAIAIFYDQQSFKLPLLLAMLGCMVCARNAAMAFNRYLDRKYDKANPRTAQREIPAGKVSSKEALWFTIINCLIFVGITYFINPLCFYLSPIALFVILFYSYTKRFTPLCHLVLGLGLSFAPLGSYILVTGYFDWLPVFFSLIVLFWVAGFDIIYALQDEDFDKKQKLYSIPSVLGTKKALFVARMLHIFSALFVLAAGYYGFFHWTYYIGATIFAFFLIYQHSLVKPNDLSKVTMAFQNANGIASITFAIFTIIALYLY